MEADSSRSPHLQPEEKGMASCQSVGKKGIALSYSRGAGFEPKVFESIDPIVRRSSSFNRCLKSDPDLAQTADLRLPN